MSLDCVLVDCSGSMGAGFFKATSKTPTSLRSAMIEEKYEKPGTNTRIQKALDMLYDMHQDGKIYGRTLIVPFDSTVRGGITMDLLLKMSRDEVMKLFEPAGGTNIAEAFKYCGSVNTLLITDFPDAGYVMGECCPIIYLD